MADSAPFDYLAQTYDAEFTTTAIGRLQRAVVHTFLKTIIRPGADVLELNCGTGEDAVWLAGQGHSVLATDISTAMLAQTAEKARRANLEDRIRTQIVDLRALSLRADVYDIILSNFGGLNCLSPGEIKRLGTDLPGLLKPGGVFVAVVMGRFCWWETLYFLVKGRWREAFRRRSRQAVLARLNAETTTSTWYYSPRQFQALFPGWRVLCVGAVGIWLPPSYLDPWFSRRPRLLAFLQYLEKKCRAGWWAGAADHFLVALTPA